MDSPYNSSAVAYHMRGWHPFPLWNADQRGHGKSSPPKGYTGRDGANATRVQVEEWRDTGRYFNLGTRLPVTVVALDVDAYHGGDKTLADLEAAHGRLPRTYTVTARTDGSGHRYYQVPGKRVWQNPGEGIEILHWGWRYAVLPPSIHPETGTPYTWYGPDGQALVNQLGPKPDALPMLPKPWITFLDTGKDPSVSPAKAVFSSSEVTTLLRDWATDEDPCPHMWATLDEAVKTTEGGRHDACMRAQMKLVRYAEGGHPGGRTALGMLQRWFWAAMDGVRDPAGEWRRGLVNATELIGANLTPAQFWGCRTSLVFTPDEITIPTQRIRTETRAK